MFSLEHVEYLGFLYDTYFGYHLSIFNPKYANRSWDDDQLRDIGFCLTTYRTDLGYIEFSKMLLIEFGRINWRDYKEIGDVECLI